ncbi:hypothetical protein [Prosthecomicrobium pneumaticum]|uniref:Uncharacterized protein n=1 Tax=Prosthecomicrobium pneumaticum TaxID=81895 RepID=A0A7W9FNF3_9HYPH|nr:hypothetical protein [Prosthecomicrobium pneumaticum]MBB5753883.1 hypothetical protein [Prosthecomicrobium pneumaticum]
MTRTAAGLFAFACAALLGAAAAAQSFDPPVGRNLPSVTRHPAPSPDPLRPRIVTPGVELPQMGPATCRTTLGASCRGRVEIIGRSCYCRENGKASQGTTEPSRR